MRAHPAYDPEILVGSWISKVSYRQHACGFYSTLDIMYVRSTRSSDEHIGRLACKQLPHIGGVGEITPHLRFLLVRRETDVIKHGPYKDVLRRYSQFRNRMQSDLPTKQTMKGCVLLGDTRAEMRE